MEVESHEILPVDGHDALAQLASTLRQLSTVTERDTASVPEELLEPWRQVAQLLKEATCKVSDLLTVTREAQQEQLLHSMLQGWNRQLLALKSGTCALLPMAWPSGRSRSRQAVLAVLRRQGEQGSIALVNLAGSGSEYHPQQLSSCATRPLRQISPVICSLVPWSRLCSSVFWLFVLRPLVTGMQADSHPALLYEALLPFLSKEDRGQQVRKQMSYDWGVRWCPVPRHDDTKIHAVFEALTLALQSLHPPAVAEWLMLILRFQSLKASSFDICSMRALARRAAQLGEVPLPEPAPSWPMKILDQIESWLATKLEVKDEGRALGPLAVWTLDPGSLNLSGFQRLLAFREEDPEEAERPPLVLPVPLVLVSRDRVQDYHEAAVAMRNCVRSCALLMNQRTLVFNADRHVLAMVQHLFYEVLPMPLPISKGVSACFWRSMPMYYETQASLVRELWLVVQYFLASSLSLPLNTHHHSVRLLTLVSALSILDSVVRRNPAHSQNDLSRVYSGALRADARSGAFAVALQSLAESTEELPLSDPHAQEIRSGLLDYFASAGENASRKARRIFAFQEMRLSSGDKEFIHRLALLRGCISGSCAPESSRLARYLTGEDPEILSAFPGLVALRDVSFLVHLLCVKITSANLDIRRNDGKPWNASDLLLKWEYHNEEGRLRVHGLQRFLVLGEALGPGPGSERQVEANSFLSRLGSAMTSLLSSSQGSQTPALVSAAGPSYLAGQSIQNEDDVLQTPELPTFGNQLTQAESEELISFLTVPYLRVPLLLQFFNDRKRFTALSSPQLQAMLDAVLFEAGPFEEANKEPEKTPCPDKVYPGLQGSEGAHLLATPAGRLVHELVHSPAAVVGELDAIFRLAMERDVPQYASSTSSAVLYTVRLWTRVTAYAGLVARSSSFAEAAPRGFVASSGHAKMLEERAKLWESRLLVEAVPMLERWCRRAMANGEMQISCLLWLHLALIQRSVTRNNELTPHGVSTLLCAELFVNANLDTSSMGSRSQAEFLGFLDTEIFELFHATRSCVYRWLRLKISERDKIFEHVVSTVASNPGDNSHGGVGRSTEFSAVRRWIELEDTWDGSGCFAAAATSDPAVTGPSPLTVSADEDFPRWLSASVDSAPVEVNVNLGQLQFRQHNVTAVPREVMELPEFQEVFPNVEMNSCLLWALVEKAKQRERYRFAGLRYEFHLWKCDQTLPEIPYVSRRFPQHATVSEEFDTLPSKGFGVIIPSAVWAFERLEGTWHSIPWNDDTKQLDPRDVTIDETQEAGSPLINARLFQVMKLMSHFGDRRMPSNVWDFDCRTRCLGDSALKKSETRGNESGIWQCCRELHERLPNLAFTQLPALASKPFMALGLNGVLGTADASDKDAASLRFLAEQSSMLSTVSGRSLLRRLKADFENYGEMRQQTFQNITSSAASQVLQDRPQLEALQSQTESLIQALGSMLQEDTDAMYEAIEATKAMANGDGYTVGGGSTPSRRARRPDTDGTGTFSTLRRRVEKLRRWSGDLSEVTFQDIVQMLLVHGGIEKVLPHWRPSMEAPVLRDIAASALLAMRFSARVLLCRQSLASLRKLKGVADRQLRMVDSPENFSRSTRRTWWSRLSGRFTRDDTEDPLAPELAEAAAEAAQCLGADAHSMDGMCYDPRLITFEFLSRLVLRKKQVILVKAMQNAIEDGEPLVHQMLMGDGKTTVVTPLVVLLHGSATRACVVCVPQALTEFTCRSLRERLCATLARPVVEFNFNRATPVSDDHFFKLLHAQDARAVMVSGPTALKSLMLRFVLTLHACDVARSKEEERLEMDRSSSFMSPNSWKSLLRWPTWSSGGGVSSQVEALGFEARALAWALDVFRGAVLLLDDIDLLMHPLRSELHWPLGTQHHLDFTASGSTSTLTLREDDQHEGNLSFVAGSPVGARWQLAFHLLDGFFSCGHQGTLPMGPAYTAQQGNPAAMVILEELEAAVQRGLRSKRLQQAPHLVLLSLDFYHKELRPILADWALIWLKSSTRVAKKLKSYWCGDSTSVEDLAQLGDAQLKAINLIRTWLATLFPHLASRIHRVHYGLLDEASPTWAAEAPARRQLAVPFVGKDAPSDSSQFSHPDVLIGLTWLAYRFGGLRQGDFRRAVKSLARQGRLEESELRRSARRSWAQWVRVSGGHLRGSEASAATGEVVHNSKSLVLSERTDSETPLVPPLEWLDSSDAAQLALVFGVMKFSPFLMEYYLHTLVLPTFLRHADAKLSANGQDLGGEVLCSSRLGFSGTPNDLLPRSLGQCRYAQGDDAKMLTTLSDPQVVQVSSVEDGWNALKLLQMVAKHTPPLNALIDVGALITGLSNEQVARTLLDYGLPFEAVVFCDSGGGQQLLRRNASASVKMSNCTLPLERRFVFYDQVHTTGIDIRHPPHACAALTLGKDSTFRDFAQGAYRLRGIKKGQRLQVLLIPEVAARVDEEISVPTTDDAQSTMPTPQVSLLDRVCAWLLVRQAAAEQTQRRLLSRQAVQYQGRRYAYETLVKKIRMGQGTESSGLLDLFRERVDYTVEASLMPGASSPLGRSLQQLAESVSSYLDVDGKKAVNVIISGTTEDVWAQRGEEEQSLFAEMEQEHEQELFAEQEEEQEQEQEEEEEEEAGDTASPSASSFQKLPRNEAQTAWPVELLRKPPNQGDMGGLGRHFRPARAMALGSSRGSETAHFPQELWASQNFHRGEQLHRLRPPVAILEWIPEDNVPDHQEGSLGMSPHKSGDSSPSQKRTRLHTALELHGLLGKASISRHEVKALLASLGVNALPSEVELVLHAIVEQAADDACQFDVDDLGENSLEDPSSSVRLLRKALSPRTVARALRRCHAVEAEPGRFYALLSLGEAEGLRALMHRREMPCKAALKFLRREALAHGLMVLDATKEWKVAGVHWHEARLAQSLTFLASQTHFSQHVLDSLWQQFRTRSPALILEMLPTQATQGDALRDFFVASMSCRRCFAQDGAWREAPVAQLFMPPSAAQRASRERTLSKAYRHFTHAGVSPEAAFAKLDTDQDGEVTPQDFAENGGTFEMPKERLRLFETLDTAKRGSISAEEWMAAFEITRPPAVVKQSGEPLPAPEGVPLDVLRRMVIELVNHTSYTQLWTSEGMLCRKHVSIWAPENLVGGLVRVTALKMSLGHYANRGFSDAGGGDSLGVGRRSILQVRDRRAFRSVSSEEYLKAVADHYCPTPIRWRQVWSQNRGTALYLWRPVPPSDTFVALGMVCTKNAEPPPLTAARCVCKSFCRQSLEAPVQLWDDSGSGGKPASIWLVNAAQVLWASVGHNVPHETFWELAADSITFDYLGRPSLHVVHEVASPHLPRRDSSTVEVEVETSSWSLTSLFSNRRRSV